MKISGVLITFVFSVVFSISAIAELQGLEESNVGVESSVLESAQDLDPKIGESVMDVSRVPAFDICILLTMRQLLSILWVERKSF